MLKISPLAAQSVRSAILVTGSARSGTTIMGQVIGSFAGVEYAFEPPMLFTLFSLIEDLSEYQWRLLYETYLYEEFLINAMAGRNFNFNRLDDSLVHRVKLEEEIERRLNQGLSKCRAEQLALGSTLAYKMPDVLPMMPTLKRYYPETRVLVMLRDAAGTINSILAKKWFNDASADKNQIWPFDICNRVRVPFWVKPVDMEYWTTLSELDRAAYYYVRINEEVENIPGRFEVIYNNLIMRPKEVVGEIGEKLGLEFGPKTMDVVTSIHRNERRNDFFNIENINSDLRCRVKYHSERSSLI